MQAFRDTYSDFHMEKTTLKAIMQNSPQFGGVFFVSYRRLLQLPLVNQKGVLMKPSKGFYSSFNRWLWEKLQMHELVEIVQQSCQPDFAQLLNKV